jgi:hypothetical protein
VLVQRIPVGRIEASIYLGLETACRTYDEQPLFNSSNHRSELKCVRLESLALRSFSASALEHCQGPPSTLCLIRGTRGLYSGRLGIVKDGIHTSII